VGARRERKSPRTEPESQARITALAQGLQEAGWAVGRNLRIDVRWSSGDLARLRKDADDLVALGPDVIVAGVGPTVSALQRRAALCRS
jgi:putative ABC transport system substrate-binding protein